ncbi:MAG: beta-ketoacyl synthase N-terminal-like domain-containing protein, partial [Gammaproteobacteria bacterium]
GHNDSIAIIGMGCRFPGGAESPEQFWSLLQAGFDSSIEVPKERWNIDAYYDPNPDVPGKMISRKSSFLTSAIADFDAEFFRISPREAEYLDPQQRLLLEVTWEALEDSGIEPKTLNSSLSGVFIGLSSHDYEDLLTKALNVEEIDAYFVTGNAASTATGRISYTLGLQGPSLAVDTACSSSLVALHQACQSLRLGESNLAIAGGVNVLLSPALSIDFSQAHMLAADGHCKTFDASADGYVRGEGCGIVILKRLSDAQRDHDRILAIISGSAVNQDGTSSGLTVPNGPSQEAVIRQALDQAQLNANDIDYI